MKRLSIEGDAVQRSASKPAGKRFENTLDRSTLSGSTPSGNRLSESNPHAILRKICRFRIGTTTGNAGAEAVHPAESRLGESRLSREQAQREQAQQEQAQQEQAQTGAGSEGAGSEGAGSASTGPA